MRETILRPNIVAVKGLLVVRGAEESLEEECSCFVWMGERSEEKE